LLANNALLLWVGDEAKVQNNVYELVIKKLGAGVMGESCYQKRFNPKSGPSCFSGFYTRKSHSTCPSGKSYAIKHDTYICALIYAYFERQSTRLVRRGGQLRLMGF